MYKECVNCGEGLDLDQLERPVCTNCGRCPHCGEYPSDHPDPNEDW